MEKKLAFEYFIFKLHEWFNELQPNINSNDLSTLKILKLLFFGTAINSNESDSILDTTFNKFCAMPYGHVESDIYKMIQSGDKFERIELYNRYSTIIENPNWPTAEKNIFSKIDSAIDSLKLANINLILMSSSDLVNLSHQWYSWQFYFNKAKSKGTFSEFIPADIIKKEKKFYSL